MMNTGLETVFTEELYNLPKPLAIAIDRPWNAISKTEIEFLSKIASSIKLSLAQVQIIDSLHLSFQQEITKPDKMIGFGIAIPGAAHYELVSLPPTRLVLAHSLPHFMGDESLKKKFWIAFQQLMAS